MIANWFAEQAAIRGVEPDAIVTIRLPDTKSWRAPFSVNPQLHDLPSERPWCLYVGASVSRGGEEPLSYGTAYIFPTVG